MLSQAKRGIKHLIEQFRSTCHAAIYNASETSKYGQMRFTYEKMTMITTMMMIIIMVKIKMMDFDYTRETKEELVQKLSECSKK